MPSRFGALIRLCGVLLLVLAVSPATAPFSTFDPGVFFHESAPQTGAILQAKPAHDDPVAAAGAIFLYRVRLERADRRQGAGASAPRTRIVLDPPLRI